MLYHVFYICPGEYHGWKSWDRERYFQRITCCCRALPMTLSMDIMESLSTKYLSAMEQVRHTNFHNAGWKICDLLLIFAEHYGVPYDGKILIKEKISQQLLSNLLGINRVTAVRAIKELKEMALIEQINGYYCIRSLEKLKRHQERMCQ
jgi:CRP/FNR family cyclic AMP-dependent transcriptional regulator